MIVSNDKDGELKPIRAQYILDNKISDIDFVKNSKNKPIEDYIKYLEDLNLNYIMWLYESEEKIKKINSLTSDIDKIIATTPGNHPMLKEIYKSIEKIKKISTKK